MKDKILIVGSGGREHALAWKLSQSKDVEKIFVVPGNDGMDDQNKIFSIQMEESDFEGIARLVKKYEIKLVVIGPEKPLAMGIVDYLEKNQIKVVGPGKYAAQLESSKIFAKKFMLDHGIPTARFEYYDNYTNAVAALDRWDIVRLGIVIKADELASGKGVVVTHNPDEAKKTVYDFMQNPSCMVRSKRILLEEKLAGKEVSFFALCDGENFVSLGHACDYKRLFDNNLGPNTGGMGGYTPTDFPDKNLILEIEQKVFERTITGMNKLGNPFKGFLFAGLMIKDNKVNVLEYNVRFGDPEAQIIMPTITEDLYPLLKNASSGQLGSNYYFKSNKLKSVHVVFASGGYPSNFNEPMKLDEIIHISPDLLNRSQTHLFFSGVKKSSKGLVNSGGRVLGVTCTGIDVESAKANCYQCVEKISFNHAHWRSDIANE